MANQNSITPNTDETWQSLSIHFCKYMRINFVNDVLIPCHGRFALLRIYHLYHRGKNVNQEGALMHQPAKEVCFSAAATTSQWCWSLKFTSCVAAVRASIRNTISFLLFPHRLHSKNLFHLFILDCGTNCHILILSHLFVVFLPTSWTLQGLGLALGRLCSESPNVHMLWA